MLHKKLFSTETVKVQVLIQELDAESTLRSESSYDLLTLSCNQLESLMEDIKGYRDAIQQRTVQFYA